LASASECDLWWKLLFKPAAVRGKHGVLRLRELGWRGESIRSVQDDKGKERADAALNKKGARFARAPEVLFLISLWLRASVVDLM